MTTVTISDAARTYAIILEHHDADIVNRIILTELRRNSIDFKDKFRNYDYIPQMYPIRSRITYLDIGVIAFLAGGALYALFY